MDSSEKSLRAKNLRLVFEGFKKLSLKEMMSYWISAEIDEAELYSDFARRADEFTDDSRVKRLFSALARERIHNAEVLMEEYSRIYPGEALQKVELLRLCNDVTLVGFGECFREGNIEKILRFLIKSEMTMAKVYSLLSKEFDDERCEFLENLSRVEIKHYQSLSRLYKGLLEPPDLRSPSSRR